MSYPPRKISGFFNKTGFTLLELLIVFGVVSILSVAVITVINPSELILSTRDGKRMSDLSTLNRILGLYLVNNGTVFGDSSTIYVSLPSDNSDCSDLELPELQAPYSYHCQTEASYQKVDGTGWLPVDLTTISLGTPISALPLDPTNDNQYYYTYTPDSSNKTWELTAPIVSLSKKKYAQNDGGNDPNLFEIGANLISAPQIAYVYNPLEDQVFTGIGVVYAQSAPTAGQVSVFSDATHIYGTNNLFWDTTNARLGIGTADPSVSLDVTGAIHSTGDIYTAAWTDYSETSTVVGWSSIDYKAIYTKKIGKTVFVKFYIQGTSNSTATTFTVPYSSIAVGGGEFGALLIYGSDNSSNLTAPGVIKLPIGSNIVYVFKGLPEVVWTASGTKRIQGQFFYEAAN